MACGEAIHGNTRQGTNGEADWRNTCKACKSFLANGLEGMKECHNNDDDDDCNLPGSEAHIIYTTFSMR